MASTNRTKQRFHNETMEIIVGCFGSLGLLAGTLPQVAYGPIGMILLAGGSLSTCMFVVANMRWGKSIGASVLLALLPAIIAFGLVYGCMWYFTSYLASQPDLFTFSLSVPKATPTP